MDAVDDTPVTLPGRPPRRAESPDLDGIPETREFETTGQMMKAVLATNPSEDLMTAFVQKAAEAFAANNSGGGDGRDPEETLKEMKRHKWLAALLALLFGSGGMVGSYYALKAQTASNTEKVEAIEKAAKAAAPRIEKNASEIRLIKADVSDFNKAVGEVKAQNKEIAEGVESLKQVNVNRLEKENEKLEREIRRLERNR